MIAEQPDAAEAFGDRPKSAPVTIRTWCGRYWRAYRDLINDRDFLSHTTLLPSVPGAPPLMQIVNTPKPIAWKTFDAFAARSGLEGEDYRQFLQIMRAMDDEYLDVMAKKAKGISDDDDDDEDAEDA